MGKEISLFLYLMAWIVPALFFGIAGCDRNIPPQHSSVTLARSVPSPLIEATLAGDLEKVRSLLQSGTDPNIVHNTNTPLIYVARDGLTVIVSLLIDSGADINWIDGEQVTPLILASLKDHREIVELLLKHGADTTIIDQWDRTALDYALRRGEADPIVQLLRSAQ